MLLHKASTYVHLKTKNYMIFGSLIFICLTILNPAVAATPVPTSYDNINFGAKLPSTLIHDRDGYFYGHATNVEQFFKDGSQQPKKFAGFAVKNAQYVTCKKQFTRVMLDIQASSTDVAAVEISKIYGKPLSIDEPNSLNKHRTYFWKGPSSNLQINYNITSNAVMISIDSLKYGDSCQ